MARKLASTKADSLPFDCEVTSLVHDGDNFAVIHVNDQRTRDGVPTLNTDWWNYGGLTRDVSLIETPDAFVDDYSLQLQRGCGHDRGMFGARGWRRGGNASDGEDPGAESLADWFHRRARAGDILAHSQRICSGGRRRLPSSTTSRSSPATTI